MQNKSKYKRSFKNTTFSVLLVTPNTAIAKSTWKAGLEKSLSGTLERNIKQSFKYFMHEHTYIYNVQLPDVLKRFSKCWRKHKLRSQMKLMFWTSLRLCWKRLCPKLMLLLSGQFWQEPIRRLKIKCHFSKKANAPSTVPAASLGKEVLAHHRTAKRCESTRRDGKKKCIQVLTWLSSKRLKFYSYISRWEWKA